MAIARPVTKTIISTTGWGIPVTDQVNTNTTDIANLKTSTQVTAWTAVTFLNSWTNYGSPYQLTQYRKRGDMVDIRGVVKGGAGLVPIFNLPTGFRPPMQEQFACESGNAHANVEIRPNGDVVLNFPTAANNPALSIQLSFSTV